ncbi:G-protein beta WD-40 repeats containing protein [Reticulomyxa filosa]|uniref:G-protein beta WD-40 repeats containing protein n=1 Tax=Reticulomyxa filosa TaxID=46433 RepID=X6M2K9_RETFI|nr:G-protein beta WD-40 repeats containing protein [Reticulomyxa filosa]|eukprot:ETO07225.1 G-protein beta WD-40 repeats containing protein [Reticulomyxa filosa]
MITSEISMQLSLSKKEEIPLITQHWIRILKIKLGWIHDFDQIIIKYVMFFAIDIFIFDIFRSSSKLLETFSGHKNRVNSIDYSILDSRQLLCSGSDDNTVCLWDIENNKQIQTFNGHLSDVNCVKFSSYHYHNHCRTVICSSSEDKTIRFWDFKHNQQLQIFNEHTKSVYGIEFSSFNGGRYLCSGSADNTIRLWDIETHKSLHVFNGHKKGVACVDILPLQSNNNKNDNKSNNIGVIGGNGYTICSGSWDNTIRIWDIETTKGLIVIKGHQGTVRCVKHGSNELLNTLLSGSYDKSVCMWDIRSGEQIQVFNGHKYTVYAVEYSPFVIDNKEIGCSSNVICSGSYDNTIRFWDIRSNKNQLYVIKGNDKEDYGIICFKFVLLKKKRNNEQKTNDNCCVNNLYYGSDKGPIRVWG